MFGSTLSIDLGASFTKVARLPACRPTFGHAVVKAAKVLAVDGLALIPSIAIRTGRDDQPWVFGQDAAGLRPGPRMEVYRNWKANLFQSQNNRDSAAAAVVAEQFFRWLRSVVGASGVNLDDTTVHVAMPAFQQFEENAAVVSKCMQLAGWDDVVVRRVTEPHANLLGLMSGGVSAVQVNRARDPFVNYGKMFGNSSPWVRAARKYVLHSRGPSRIGVLVTDIGAFTTDFAHLMFDFADNDHLGDGLSALCQTSVAHGIINQLDRPVFDELARRHSLDWTEFPLAEVELVKQAIYAGRVHRLVTRDSRSMEVGGAADRMMIEEAIEGFALGVWENLRRFRGNHPVQLAYLTGGGALVAAIRERLRQQFRAEGVQLVPSPFRASPPEVELWREWTQADGGLERLATALGGTNIAMRVAKEPARAGQARVPDRPQPPPRVPGPVTCRCGGMNPECAYCGGRGFVQEG